MSMYPRESDHPKYNMKEYEDSYKKYFMYATNHKKIETDSVRIFNIVGQSYGNLADCAYIVNLDRKIEFMLSAVIYVNEDGIDMALCAIDVETNVMQYSGANIAFYLIRNNQFSFIEPDYMPVGIFPIEKPFTQHEIQLECNDVIYLFSDGFQSQFGGKKDETFKIKRFKDLLSEINHLPMADQKAIVEQRFYDWKGSQRQTDDVLILGVRI